MRRLPLGFGSCVVTFGTLAGLGFLGCGQGFTSAPADAGGATPDHASPVDARPPVDHHVDDRFVPDDSGAPDAVQMADVGPVDAGPCHGADLSKDKDNCGACGHQCLMGGCSGSECAVTTSVSGLKHPDAIAVDPMDDVFYSVLGPCSGATCGPGSIERLPSGSSTSAALDTIPVTSTAGLPVVIDAASVYWAVPGVASAIKFLPISGSGTPAYITPPGTASWIALAVDDAYLYAGESGGSIEQASTSSPTVWTGAATNASEVLSGMAALSTSGDHYLFWANRMTSGGSASSGSVWGAKIVGKVLGAPWSQTGLDSPGGVAASGDGAFWVDTSVPAVDQVPLLGKPGSPDVLVSGAPTPVRIAASADGSIYWTTQTGTVMGLYHGSTTPFTLATGQTGAAAIVVAGKRLYWVNGGLGGSVQWTWR